MGHRRLFALLVLLVLVLLLLFLWTPALVEPPSLPTAADPGEARPAPEAPAPDEGTDTVLSTGLLPLRPPAEPPWRSGPPAIGPGLGDGLFGGRAEEDVTWLTGRLVDTEGKPVGGVGVRVEPELPAGRVVVKKNRRTGTMERVLELPVHFGHSGIWRGGRMMQSSKGVGVTNADGTFTVRAPGGAGSYHLQFTKKGESSAILHRTKGYRYTPGHRANLEDVRIPAGGTLAGRVTGLDGESVEGAAVTFWPEAWGRTMEELSTSRPTRVDRVEFRGRRIGGSASGLGTVHTDEEGRFRIPGVPPGVHTVSVYRPGVRGRPVNLEGVRVHGGEEVAGLTIVVEAAPTPLIAGRVTDAETGKPVRAILNLHADPRTHRKVRCRENGRFLAAAVEPGDYKIYAWADGYGNQVFGPFALTHGKRIEDVELRLSPKEK